VVVSRALEVSRPLLDARRQELTVTLPPEPVWVEADPIRLAQVISNLLNNAAKYTQEGGKVALSVERQGSEVAITVRDTRVDQLLKDTDIHKIAVALDQKLTEATPAEKPR